MAETMNATIDDLPELGTKAAAVAGIESMLYAAIRLREPFSPLQLRYWLDAYYQARIAAAGWTEARTSTPPTWDEIRDVLHRQAGLEDGGPPRASAPTEEAEYSTAPEDAAETQQTAEDAAETQQTAEDATSSVTASAVTPSPQGEAQSESRPRQKPVGWTDGFEPVEIKKGPAAEAAKFKREQFERLQRFLREGVTMQRIVKAADGNITEDQILGIRECRRVPVAVYRVLEAALDRIETD